jgi:biotin carboxyl carrier protein
MAKYYVDVDGQEIGVEVLDQEGRTVIRRLDGEQAQPEKAVDFAAVHCNIDTGEGLYSLLIGGKSHQVHVERTGEGLRIVIGRHRGDVRVQTEREWRLKKVAPRQAQQTGQMNIKAPMPGLVKAVLVAEGDEVQEGQRLVVLEAMKMENEITTPRQGRVAAVHIAQGATVESGKPLVTLE